MAVLYVILAAILGIVLGTGLAARLPKTAFTASPETERDANFVRVLLCKIHDITLGMARKVSQHNEMVREINDRLSGLPANSPESVSDIIVQLLDANQHMQRQLDTVQTRLEEQAELLEDQAAVARTDPLTGLPNRRALDEAINTAIELVKEQRRQVSLTMLDIDHFKRVNDTYGHRVGDDILRHVAQGLQKQVQANETLARFGGEEFAVLHEDMDVRRAVERTEALRQAIEKMEISLEGSTHRITISAGTAQCKTGESLFDFFDRADFCLYSSKQAGRNCTHYNDGERVLPYPAAETAGTAPARGHGDMEDLVDSTTTLLSESEHPEAGAESRPSEAKAPQEDTLPTITAEIFDDISRSAPTPGDVPRRPVSPLERRATTRTTTENGGSHALANRTFFCSSLGKRLADFRENETPVGVILVQIDQFLNLQRNFGREATDAATQALSELLVATVRGANIAAQLDEKTFALLLPGANLESTGAVGEQLRSVFAGHEFVTRSGPFNGSLSLGVAASLRTDSVSSILTRAENVLQQAIESGGNRCLCHDGATAYTA